MHDNSKKKTLVLTVTYSMDTLPDGLASKLIDVVDEMCYCQHRDLEGKPFACGLEIASTQTIEHDSDTYVGTTLHKFDDDDENER